LEKRKIRFFKRLTINHLKKNFRIIWYFQKNILILRKIVQLTKTDMQEKESKTNSHFYISLVKSILRIGACYFLFNEQFGNAAIILASAEILGIAEEIF